MRSAEITHAAACSCLPRLATRGPRIMTPTPDLDFIHETFPEPVMPACSAIKLLRGQRALVTGARSGVGKAVAIALGHAGADVAVNYVSGPDDAEVVAKEIRRCGSNALPLRAD